MTNKEITKVIFNNSEISALYYGDVLIWKKGNGSQQYGEYDLCGVFTDDITDTRNSINIYYTDNTSENVPIPYNSETKEFKYTIKKPYKRITFVDYDYWKNITHIPNNNEATTMYNLFHGLRNLTSLNISNLDTSKATELYGMFDGCLSLTSLDLSNFNTASVTDMSRMFDECEVLNSLDLSSFNTASVTDMSRMFEYCKALTALDLSNFNTSNVTTIYRTFRNCEKLTSIDLSSFDTTKVTNMEGAFAGCRALTALDLSNFNTSNVTKMGGWNDGLFYNCWKLTTLDLSNFDVSKVTTMESMFNSCYELATLVLSNFDVSNVTNMDDMFERCDKLTTVTGVFEGTKVNLDLHWSPLTNASAMVFINGLANVTSTKTIKFNSTTYNTLTPEQIAVATSKGWTVARVD